MKFCKFINDTITFSNDGIMPCFSVHNSNIPLYDKNTINLIDFKSQQNNLLSQINSDKIKDLYCEKCCHLQEASYEERPYCMLVFKYWSYVNDAILQKHYASVKSLYEADLVNKEGLHIQVNCGDISYIANLNDFLNLFEENGYQNIDFLFNNVKYNQKIENILEKGTGTLSIIIDAKTDLKKYEYGITQTLRKYITSAKDKNAVRIYYTLTKNEKNAENNVKQFIELMYRIGINTIGLRLDNTLLNEWINKPIPKDIQIKDYKKAILYFLKLTKKYCFYLDMDYPEQNIVIEKILKKNKASKISFLETIKNLFNKS